jgi:hypothetical protein
MKMIFPVRVSACLAVALMTGAASANQPATRPSSNWSPPSMDAPADRIGGAARGGSADATLLVSLLAPSASVGLTSRSQPTLYWYLSAATDSPVEITLTPAGQDGKSHGSAPILDLVIPKTPTAGIQALSLAKPPGQQAPVSLQPGVQYDWVIAVEMNDRGGSDNPSAATRLQRIKASAALSEVESAPLMDQYESYRQAGLWFDMLDSLNRMIDADRKNAGLRETRHALLKDQNLIEDKDGKISERPTTGAGRPSGP